MPRQFDFDADKALAATAYLAGHTGESMYPIFKMLYLVDRLHLERYGRPVTGDRYVAMKEGPAPSAIYDCMKVLRGDRQFSTCPNAEAFLEVNPRTHDVSVRKMPEMDVMSATDMECLEAIIEAYKTRGSKYVVEQSHDEAWKATSKNRFMDIMTIAATLKDGPVLTQHLAERFTEKT